MAAKNIWDKTPGSENPALSFSISKRACVGSEADIEGVVFQNVCTSVQAISIPAFYESTLWITPAVSRLAARAARPPEYSYSNRI
jgi:hypothetical protein